MRRIALLFFLAALVAGVAGCALWPSTWRPFGSPLDRNERAQAKLGAAQADAIGGAQAAVHKATAAISAAPQDNRAVAVARDFIGEAQALLDQAHGAPNAADEAQWRELVAGLLSDNAAVRAAAERQHAADSATTADLAHRLAIATADAQRANTRALGYARDREALANFAAKLKLGFFALVGLLVLGLVLSILSRFFPAFSLAAKAVNGVVAPGITYIAQRAESGLHNVGAAIADLRSAMPDQAGHVTQLLDAATDTDQQRLIAVGAAQAAASHPLAA